MLYTCIGGQRVGWPNASNEGAITNFLIFTMQDFTIENIRIGYDPANWHSALYSSLKSCFFVRSLCHFTGRCLIHFPFVFCNHFSYHAVCLALALAATIIISLLTRKVYSRFPSRNILYLSAVMCIGTLSSNLFWV